MGNYVRKGIVERKCRDCKEPFKASAQARTERCIACRAKRKGKTIRGYLVEGGMVSKLYFPGKDD